MKYPTGCGASGHRLISLDDEDLPGNEWPCPFVLQHFLRLDRPEVFRLYAVAGETFGWNARRFPASALGLPESPFVAHALGARHEDAGALPPEVEAVARAALEATGLLDSFGCADLMRDASGGRLCNCNCWCKYLRRELERLEDVGLATISSEQSSHETSRL